MPESDPCYFVARACKAQFQEVADAVDSPCLPESPIDVSDAEAYTADSTSAVFAARSKEYLTELVASVAPASPQHHYVDQLADLVVNLAGAPSTAVAAAVKEYWAADYAAKAVDEWRDVLVAAASQQFAEVGGVMIAQTVVRNSIDSVEYHSE